MLTHLYEISRIAFRFGTANTLDSTQYDFPSSLGAQRGSAHPPTSPIGLWVERDWPVRPGGPQRERAKLAAQLSSTVTDC